MLALILAAVVENGCTAPSPAVTTVALQGVTRTAYLNRYAVSATVTNRGDQAQPGNVLQFLDVVYYDQRIDARGIPPLAPGQSYTITYSWPRSSDAGRWTSPLNFRVRTVAPATSDPCSGSSAGITV